MSKIICEICGTSYQESAASCPICGCPRDAAAELLGEELLVDETLEEAAENEAAASRKKQIFDFDEVNAEAVPEQTVEVTAEPDEEDEEDQPRANTFVVILLTVLIAALLLAAGFIFVKFFLPNMGTEEETTPVVTEAVVETTQAPTTELRIPCETLILNSGPLAEIRQAGFNHLVNVTVSPADTTDAVTFVSADESIATVTADGKITAVAEGETIVTVSCGAFSFDVRVVCDFTPETVPPTEETVAATTEAEAETEAPTEASRAPVDPSIELKLKEPDISMGVYYEVQLQLDCDLEPTDVQWSSEHPHIASVDENGVVRALKAGTTDIIVRYGDQEVRCRVRCRY